MFFVPAVGQFAIRRRKLQLGLLFSGSRIGIIFQTSSQAAECCLAAGKTDAVVKMLFDAVGVKLFFSGKPK